MGAPRSATIWRSQVRKYRPYSAVALDLFHPKVPWHTSCPKCVVFYVLRFVVHSGVGVDSVDDDSKPDQSSLSFYLDSPLPGNWTIEDNWLCSYYLYNMYANMTALNHGKISILRVNSSNMVKVRGRDSVSQWESVGTMHNNAKISSPPCVGCK